MNDFTYETYYKAFDGTIFDDIDQCAEYCDKAKNEKFAGDLRLFGNELNRIPSNDVESTYYAHFNTIEAFDYFNELCEDCGTASIECSYNGNDYLYDENEREWISIANRISEYEKKIEELKEIRNKISGKVGE